MSEAFGGGTHPHQPGWFDLVSVLVEGMIANAGQEQAEAFLYSMGESLAARYPLPESRTVQDLEREFNLQLARFNWGFVQLQPQENAVFRLVSGAGRQQSSAGCAGTERWQYHAFSISIRCSDES